jgi:hypothetical protein
VKAKVVCRTDLSTGNNSIHKDLSFMCPIIQEAEATHHGDEFSPSRPGPMLLLITVIVVATVMTIMNWQRQQDLHIWH